MVPLEVVQRPKPTTLGYKIFMASTRCLLSWWPRACSLPLLGKSALWRLRACQEHCSLLRQRCSSKDSQAFWNMAFFQLVRQPFFHVEIEKGVWLKITMWAAVQNVPFKSTIAQGKKKKGWLSCFSEEEAKELSLLSTHRSRNHQKWHNWLLSQVSAHFTP